MFPAALFLLLKVSLSGSAAVTNVLRCPGGHKTLSYTEQRICMPSDCRPLGPSYINLKYAWIHIDVVQPISDGKLHPDAGAKTLIPSLQGQVALPKHCADLSLVTSHQWAPERLFQGGLEWSFSRSCRNVQCCRFGLIHCLRRMESCTSQSAVLSAEFKREDRWDPWGQNNSEFKRQMQIWLCVCSLSPSSLEADYLAGESLATTFQDDAHIQIVTPVFSCV